MDRRAHNLRFLITQAQKIGVLQEVASDEDAYNQNGKSHNRPSPIPSTYCTTYYTVIASILY